MSTSLGSIIDESLPWSLLVFVWVGWSLRADDVFISTTAPCPCPCPELEVIAGAEPAAAPEAAAVVVAVVALAVALAAVTILARGMLVPSSRATTGKGSDSTGL